MALAAPPVISALPYVFDLGFYGDDWDLLSRMTFASSQSFAGLYQALAQPWEAMRPLQLLYFAALFKTFGTAPIGYHVVNTGVLVATATVLYLVLREIAVPRRLAVSIALVYGLLPTYATVRFWFAASGHLLSMALYFVGTYAALRAARATDRRSVAWLLGSAVALSASVLVYEVPLPMCLLTVALLWTTARRTQIATGRLLVMAGTVVAPLVAVAVFKWVTTQRLDDSAASIWLQVTRIVVRAFDLAPAAESYGLNFKLAVATHFGAHGTELPRVAFAILTRQPSLVVLASAIAIGAIAFVWLRRPALDASDSAAAWTGARLFAAGLLVFWLGYAIFLTNSNLQFTPTGLSNRANIGAALGAAFIIVAAFGAVCRLLPFRWRETGSALLIAAYCAACALITGALGEFWKQAYRDEQTIIAQLRGDLAALPEQSSVILDGTCPYRGPAIVFESNWDLAGALRLTLGHPAVRADVATSLAVAPAGLTTSLYGTTYEYPFGDTLFVYDYRRRSLTPIPHRDAAAQYLATREFAPERDCPPGRAGHGVAPW